MLRDTHKGLVHRMVPFMLPTEPANEGCQAELPQMAGYIPRWFPHSKMVNYPSANWDRYRITWVKLTETSIPLLSQTAGINSITSNACQILSGIFSGAISCSSKSRLVLSFWYQLTWVVPDKGPLNGCEVEEQSITISVSMCMSTYTISYKPQFLTS